VPRLLLLIQLVGAAVLLNGAAVSAHDPSAYGGLFRSRDLGATWLNADAGLFLSAALTVAVDPRDPARLLLGTDLGLMRSESGGRSWTPEAPGLMVGAVFALAFRAGGAGAIGAAPGGIFVLGDGGWTGAEAPDGALPARAVALGASAQRVYLAGRSGLFISDDGGRSFARAPGLPDLAEITGLAVTREPRESVFAVVDGALMASTDGGRRWQPLADPSERRLETLALDPASPSRLWAAGAGRIYLSEDLGASWRPVGQPLPEPGAAVRGIAADPAITTLVVTTARGMYRSTDGGASWALKEANLPIHLEAGPLVRDPSDASTLYAVYSLMPYAEVWRTALEGSNLLARADPVSLAGGVAFLLLLMIAGGLLVRWLARQRGGAPLERGSPS
jgi:photosystem II stability/assembly factor-like uncharacterized protein